MTQPHPETPLTQPVPHPESVQHLALAVNGMHCANCVGRIEHHLLHQAGVRRASVNLVQERADIDYDAQLITAQQLIAAIHQAGYKAEIWRSAHSQTRRDKIRRIKVLICLLLSLPLLLEMFGHVLGWHYFALPPLVALGLATVVQFWGGWGFYRGAVQSLRARAANMDVLVALGSSLAYGISLWRVWQGTLPLAFESSALIIALVLLGQWIESAMRRQAQAAVHHLITLQPQQVRRIDGTGAEAMTPLPEIAVGDVIVVWGGERVPLDGEVTEGIATFDYALLTGETVPRVLGKGDAVVAGALCLNGHLKLRVTNHAGETMLDRLADMVAVAQASHPAMQRLADKAAGYFISLVLVFAVCTFAFWALNNDMATAQQAALAVLLMACPCALGLAVPMVIAVAVGQAARHGILLRDASALERAAKVTTVIFDKTGTLSESVSELSETLVFAAQSSEQVLAYAAALNQHVNHPIAAALRKVVAARSLPLALPAMAGDVAMTYGRGVQGTLTSGVTLICGNLHYMADHKIPFEEVAAAAAGLEERGRSLSWLAELTPQPRLLGLMAFRDHIRPEAQDALNSLNQQHYNLSVISGDNRHMTLSVAKRLGIGHMIGEALPQDKLQEIQKRQKWGEVVAMVGDGMNDAPALAMADLGIAMYGGVDAADATAPIRLLRDDLRLIPALFDLAKTVRRVMMINIGWAVVFNVIALPIAAFGNVPPYLAAMSMSVSSLVVIAHALTLKGWKPHG